MYNGKLQLLTFSFRTPCLGIEMVDNKKLVAKRPQFSHLKFKKETSFHGPTRGYIPTDGGADSYIVFVKI